MRNPILLVSLLAVLCPTTLLAAEVVPQKGNSNFELVAPGDAPGRGITASQSQEPSLLHHGSLHTYVDMMMYKLFLANPNTDQRIEIDLLSLPGWPGPAPLHTLPLPEGDLIYITYLASATEYSGIAALEIVGEIDWDAGLAQVRVVKDLKVDGIGAPAYMPDVFQVDYRQPISDWNRPAFSQIHGPTLHPSGRYAYFTLWTDNRILIIDTETHELVATQSFGEASAQIHGVVFNHSGTLGLSAGYFYDKDMTLFTVNPGTGMLKYKRTLKAGSNQAYGAYSHTVYWLDDRFALVGTMQFGPTSLTPRNATIVGPSVWLIDTHTGKSSRLIHSTHDLDGAGILRSASYLGLAGNKLFVAEEDSLDASFGDDGYISVFDIRDIRNPVFLKRFKPGHELPADYSVAHAISVTLDERYVIVESYHSGYMIKIDVESLSVANITGPEDGLMMPHGGVIAGRLH
jgi:DNA-binding beta-propeller fold protein YncE